jgi:dCMP deaminase
MERITHQEQYARIAQIIAMRGSCERLQVGAVITVNNRIISTGYNGPLKKDHQCSPELCDLSKPCTSAVHAEANAIYAAARSAISTQGASLYSTALPCPRCAEAIIQSGIKRVYFLNDFRDRSSIKTLLSHRVEVNQLVWLGLIESEGEGFNVIPIKTWGNAEDKIN